MPFPVPADKFEVPRIVKYAEVFAFLKEAIKLINCFNSGEAYTLFKITTPGSINFWSFTFGSGTGLNFISSKFL